MALLSRDVCQTLTHAFCGAEQGDRLPWERCELFCEELCGRETQNREMERSEEKRGQEWEQEQGGRQKAGVNDASMGTEDTFWGRMSAHGLHFSFIEKFHWLATSHNWSTFTTEICYRLNRISLCWSAGIPLSWITPPVSPTSHLNGV